MATVTQIAAARRFAPPLMTIAQADRRGARLRQVNRRAVDYAERAGMGLEDVYPGGLTGVRELAPPRGSPEASAFLHVVGLSAADVYPFGVEAPRRAARRWRWGWAAVGVLVGAALAGPIGAVVGVAGGLLGGGR